MVRMTQEPTDVETVGLHGPDPAVHNLPAMADLAGKQLKSPPIETTSGQGHPSWAELAQLAEQLWEGFPYI